MKLARHKRVQLIWVPGHTGIDGNETANQLARQRSSHPLIGPEPTLGTSAKAAMEVIRGWMNKKHEGIGSPFVNKGRLWTSLKDPLLKKSGEL